MDSTDKKHRNLTVSLAPETIRKAKILAARRSTSISGMLAAEIERLTGEEDTYALVERAALAMLDDGVHLDGMIRATRDELHER